MAIAVIPQKSDPGTGSWNLFSDRLFQKENRTSSICIGDSSGPVPSEPYLKKDSTAYCSDLRFEGLGNGRPGRMDNGHQATAFLKPSNQRSRPLSVIDMGLTGQDRTNLFTILKKSKLLRIFNYDLIREFWRPFHDRIMRNKR